MLNGLSKYSKTGAAVAIKYFMAPVWKGRSRVPPPQVLRGNEGVVGMLCSASKFSHKYTSGVLSFTPEETQMIATRPELKSAILDEFEGFAFSGVDDDSRSYLAVEHMHTGRLEIHYLIPRTHTATGLYFNPFPPGHKVSNDAFINYMCARYGLVNPRTPSRARALRVNPHDPAAAVKQQINGFVLNSIKNGVISNAEEMRGIFIGAGFEISRQGDDYVSVVIPGRQKALRMKGEIYGRGFTVESAAGIGSGARGTREESDDAAQSRYQEVINRRARFNRERYKGGYTPYSDGTVLPGSERNHAADSGAIQQALQDFSSQLRSSGADAGAAIAECFTGGGSVDIAKVLRAVGDGQAAMLMMAMMMLIEAVLRLFGQTMLEVNQEDEAVLIVSDIVRSIMEEVEQERNVVVDLGYGFYNKNNEVMYERHNQADVRLQEKALGADRAELEHCGF